MLCKKTHKLKCSGKHEKDAEANNFILLNSSLHTFPETMLTDILTNSLSNNCWPKC